MAARVAPKERERETKDRQLLVQIFGLASISGDSIQLVGIQ